MNQRRTLPEPQPTLKYQDERASAWGQSMVFMRQAYPNMALMTYDNIVHRGSEHVVLAKLVVGVGNESPTWLTWEACTAETTADNVPGGLVSRTVLADGGSLTAELYPLMAGRAPDAWEGGAVLRISCERETGLWLKFGGGKIAFMHYSPNISMAGDQIDCEESSAELDGSTVFLSHGTVPLFTAVSADADFRVETLPEAVTGRGADCGANCGASCGAYAVAHTARNQLCLTAGFARSRERARQLAQTDAAAEILRIQAYYRGLCEHWRLDTPSANLNEAFTHALYHLEYAWLEPYGWIESIQHWPTMWHMEHTAAEEWNGHSERVKTCLTAQMQRVFDNGAIPDLCPNGEGRRDWGGNNQFFLREVLHYVRMTGDLDFAAQAEPFMERALKQSFAEYDPTSSGVIGWSTQIGNQEDMESTPGKGAATGSEGVRMLEIMAELKELLGKPEEGARYRAHAAYCLDQLRQTLWLPDLGRYAWYEDSVGEKRLDTTYHGIAYPVIYGQLDAFDSKSALDHLKHRLSGPEGEIYQSNHFGDHAYWDVPTWGMQCGSDMQPFATAAYAAVGDAQAAVRPLEFIAKRVCGPYQRGAWPETANETRFAYFSPSAAVYAQAVIESIFGLSRDAIRNETVLAPCMPEDWPSAGLTLPGLSIRYEKKDSACRLELHADGDHTRKLLRLRCAPYRSISVSVNGREVPVRTVPQCGWFEAEADLGTDTVISVSWRLLPLSLSIDGPQTAACGDEVCFSLSGTDGSVELIGLDDRCGLFQHAVIAGGLLTARVRTGLLAPYEKFGPLGMMNFARRQFALLLRQGGRSFSMPCTLTLLPALTVTGVWEPPARQAVLRVQNHTARPITGNCVLTFGGCSLTGRAGLPAGSSAELRFPAPAGLDPLLSPGQNRAVLSCPGAQLSLEFPLQAAGIPARVEGLPLPDEAVLPAEAWRELGMHAHQGCILQNPDIFLKDFFTRYQQVQVIDGVPLPLNPNGFLPISQEKYPVLTLPMGGRRIKKLYLLMCAFINNSDTFARVFRVEAEAGREGAYMRPIFHRELCSPGALDMGYGSGVIAGFATFVPGTQRGALPVFPEEAGAGDYPQAVPPQYPQREFWSQSPAVALDNNVFNLIELDFGHFVSLKELRITALEADAAAGLFAVAAHLPAEPDPDVQR